MLKTAKTVMRPWLDHGWRLGDSDERFAERLGLRIEEVTRIRHGRVASERRIVIPRALWGEGQGAGRGTLFQDLQLSIDLVGSCASAPDDAVEIRLRSGRVTYRESFRSRLLSNLALLTLEPLARRRWADGSHAYIAGRSTFTALEYALALMRRGHRFAVSADIWKFFDGLDARLVASSLRETLPLVDEQLVQLVVWFLQAPIIRRRPANGEPCWERPRRHVLQGTVLSCFLSNLVGHQVLDEPMKKAFGGNVSVVRYSDDLLLLGRDPAAVEDARRFADDLLKAVGLKFHPEKGTRSAVDLQRERIPWLGKEIGKGEVRTTDQWLEATVERGLAHSADSGEFRSVATMIVSQLRLDHAGRLQFVRRALRRASPAHAVAFQEVVEQKNGGSAVNTYSEGRTAAAPPAQGTR